MGGGTNGNWQWARGACPSAVLILDDYDDIEWPTDRQNFIDITNTVLANGAPSQPLPFLAFPCALACSPSRRTYAHSAG